MNLDIDIVEESFSLISSNLDEFTVNFYSDLFSTCPEIKPLFKDVDLIRQRRKLAAMLTLIVTNLRRMDVLVSALRTLGAKHIQYGASTEFYEDMQVILLRNLKRMLGDNWDEQTASAWTNAIDLITTEMQEGAAQASLIEETVVVYNTELDILMEIASNPSLSFQRNSLFASYIEKKKSDYEMDIARDIQQSLLPTDFPVINGYHFSATYEPAKQVGGDYYDWVMKDDESICFIFGDVSGKGVPGALIMSRLSGAVRALIASDYKSSQMLSTINSHIFNRLPDGHFITLTLVNLDWINHKLKLTNAGHLPPILKKSNGETCLFARENVGIPIGVEENTIYKTVEKTINPGDTFVFYTDGITEALGHNGNLYGVNRLLSLISKIENPSEICTVLIDDIRQFAGGRPQNDDLAILTLSHV